jgi:hypothetical protein
MCAQWLVFGERVIGHVEAATRPLAERAAHLAFGQTQAIARVQSACSYECGQEEQRVAEQRRRRTEEDDTWA